LAKDSVVKSWLRMPTYDEYVIDFACSLKSRFVNILSDLKVSFKIEGKP
jgi:hypothetical protein